MGKVFAVPKYETTSGFHEVIFTRGRNLNRGRTRRFRKWSLGVEFAKRKAKELNCKPIIHRYH